MEPLHPDFIPHLSKVNAIIETMSIEERVGQLFLCHCPADPDTAIRDCHPGGFVLFARNFEERTPGEVRAAIDHYNEISRIPMIMSVDEEGGTVVRVSKFPAYRSEPFLSPKELYRREGTAGFSREAAEKARFLKDLHILLNLAPVCDYTANEESYIAKRVFGVSPEATSRYISDTVTTCLKNGVAVTLKHFPGYGGNTDTHKDMAYDGRPLSRFEEEDFRPFEAGIAAGAQCVMVSHNIVGCIDGETPASLSVPVHRLLRERFGFGGVVITDSLTMNAIRVFSGGNDPCPAALLSGNDLIITSRFGEGYGAILSEYEKGNIPEGVLRAALQRVLCLKASLGIL